MQLALKVWKILQNGHGTGSLIHGFRLPLFIIVAGFFGALLLQKRGRRQRALKRLDRILYPFVVFLLRVWPLVEIGSAFSRQVIAGNPNASGTALAQLKRCDLLFILLGDLPLPDQEYYHR